MNSTIALGSPEGKFWRWFIQNKSVLEAVKSSDDPMLATLSNRIKDYHEDIVYEMSLHAGDEREIIISGDGLKEMIPVVQKLTRAAPVIPGWRVISFRPRMHDYIGFTLNYAGESFDPKIIWFCPITNDGNFDVILYHPGYTDENRNTFIAGSYLLLDIALGEYDVMTRIRYIDHQALPENPRAEGLKPFSELREVFDAFSSTIKTEP